MASYKLVSYSVDRAAAAGLLIGDTVHDLAAEADAAGTEGFNAARVRGVLENWIAAKPVLDAIAAAPKTAGKPLSSVKLMAPIPRPSAIYCAGANYYDHAREMGTEVDKSTKEPFFFVKSGSVVVGPGDDIRLPQNYSNCYDWEIELAAFIGKEMRNATLDNALSCVAGYGIMNDLSAREMGKREDWPFGMDWHRHKTWDTSAPMGPGITPADQIADVQNLSLKTTVSGVVKQDSSTEQMIFTLAEQIVALSHQHTLYPGDIIATGTCAGVGAPNKDFLKAGDTIVMEVEGVGILENPVVTGD